MRGDAPLAMLCVARCLAVVSALALKCKCIRPGIEQNTEKACSYRISRSLAGGHAAHQARERLRSGDQLWPAARMPASSLRNLSTMSGCSVATLFVSPGSDFKS